MDDFDTLLELALREDLGPKGDVTSRAIFTDETGRSTLVAKDRGVLAGAGVFTRVFERVDPAVDVHFIKEDGAKLVPGDIAAELSGPVVSLLEGERTAINFLSFLSGIATETAAYVEAAEGRAVILDTRKTLPGYRRLSKYAVALGGARNHRMGLFDMVMIKDNHIDAAGSIASAVSRVRKRWGRRFQIEVETRNLDEVSQALEADVDIIMLDNMDAETCGRAVDLGRDRVVFEASGNMDLGRVAEYSRVGVDSISVGALTHSVNAFDYSMRMVVDAR